MEEELPETLQALFSNLGHQLRAEFHEAESYRQETEQRWIADLRQYKGEYGPEVLQNLDPDQSRVFVKMTRKKVRTVDARLRDMLFPANGDRNWDIEPTPEPELSPEDQKRLAQKLREQKQQAMQQQGQEVDHQAVEPTDKEMDQAAQAMVQRKAEAMAERMDDQLTEARYDEISSDVIHAGNVYGTGILKGPLVDQRLKQRWRSGEDGWGMVEETEYRPYYEHVPVWDCYPDMAARDPFDVRYIWQRHVMPKHEVLELADREDFDGEGIREYLRHYTKGDVANKDWEHTLRQLGERETASPNRSERYEVLERWGVISAEDLREVGDEEIQAIIEEDDVAEFWANVWMLGQVVIKVALQPIDGVDHPYHFYYFDKDETSIFGEGIPALMRDDQAIINSGTRAMLDNAAIAAGGMYEVLADLLSPGEDPRALHPRRTFVRDDTADSHTAQVPAVRQLNIQPYTDDYLAIINTGERWGHEHTVPSYMEGQATNDSGAAGTASGMSMLMGAANIEIKDLVRNFDDGITEPSIRAHYHWNMTFSEDDSIKGDYKVVAKGSSSLVAKEVRAQTLSQFGATALQDPELRSYVDIGEFVRELAKSNDVGGIILSDEERRRQQEQQGQSPDMIEAKASAAEDKADAAEAKAEAEREKTQAMKAQVSAMSEMLKAIEEYGGEEVAAMIQQMRGANDQGSGPPSDSGGGQQPDQPSMADDAGGAQGGGQGQPPPGAGGQGPQNPGARSARGRASEGAT